MGRYSSVPMTVQTCPGARKPFTRQPGLSSTARKAGGTSTWETSTEKFASPSLAAWSTAIAVAGAGGDGARRVEQLDRRDAHRTPRSVDQRQLLRQHFVQPEADDGMGLSAADLHDAPRSGNLPPDRLDQPPGPFGTAIFVDVFHDSMASI